MNTTLQHLEELIQAHRVEQLAKDTGWCKRRGKISPREFVYSLLGQASALDLTLASQAATLSQPVSRQALDQRYTSEAVALLQAVFREALAKSLDWKPDSVMTDLLGEHFQAIRIFDSTHCPCSESLAKLFPGYGGGGSKAGLKVLLGYQYGLGRLDSLTVLPANVSDQSLAHYACQQLSAGELGLFDKGFYKAQALRALMERGAFFLMPWHHGVSVWTGLPDGQPGTLVEVAKHLKASQQSREEWSAVLLGKDSESRLGPLRLVAFRLSDESANRRRAALREKYRTRGKQPSQEALELAGWLILLTNAPLQTLPSAAMAYLYRARWQVELIFKQWKSVLRLDVLPSQNRHRVECQLWGRLLLGLLVSVCHQHANARSLELYQREISFLKLARQFQQHCHTLVQALMSQRERFQTEFRRLWQRILKLARKERQPSRPTTWENLCSQWLELTSA